LLLSVNFVSRAFQILVLIIWVCLDRYGAEFNVVVTLILLFGKKSFR